MSWNGNWDEVPIPHSITFGDKNTYMDWHLVPDSRPVIVMPSPKMNIVDIPGGLGSIDLSESLTGYPLYSNRSGTLNFHVLNDYSESWVELYESITHYLHGQQRTMILADDPDWYYIGRYSVEWTSNNNGTWSDVKISYNLQPFKYSVNVDTIPFTDVGVTSSYFYPLNGEKTYAITPWLNITSIDGNAHPNVVIAVKNPELDLDYDDTSTTMGAIVANNQMLYKIILSNLYGSENTDSSDDPIVLKIYVTSSHPINGSIEYRRMVL